MLSIPVHKKVCGDLHELQSTRFLRPVIRRDTGAGQEESECPSGEDGGDAREMGDKNTPYSVSCGTSCSNKNPTVSISVYLQHFQIYCK